MIEQIIEIVKGMRGPPDYYSYYVANDSRVDFNGHWEIAHTTDQIPYRLFKAGKPYYREHWENERDRGINDVLRMLEHYKEVKQNTP